jgi:hypothetical protein
LNPKTVAREAAGFAFFLLLAIVVTWPLAIRLSTGVSDPGDPLLNAFILEWDCYGFVHQLLHLFQAPIYAPAHLPLAYSENMIGVSLILFPLWLFGAKALTLHSVAMILGFAVSGYGAWVLARVVTASVPAALVAGIFHEFLSFRISHAAHVQIIWGGWLPLILAALIVFHRNPSRRNAFLLGAAFVMNGLTNIYYLMFAGLAVVITIWMYAIVDGGMDRTYRRRLFAALIVAGLVLLPVLAPYAIVSQEYRMQRTIGDAASGSATWSDWLVPAPNNALWWPLIDDSIARPERNLFPGLLPLLLIGAALLLTPRVGQAILPVRPYRPRIIDVFLILFAILGYIGLVHPTLFIHIGKGGYTGADIPLMLFAILLIVRCRDSIRAFVERSRFSKDAWAAFVWMLVGFAGSFGLNGFFAEFLFRRTIVFRSVRAMARFACLTYAGMVVWMAIGIVALLALIRRDWLRHAVSAVLLAAIMCDVSPKMNWQFVEDPATDAHRWLDAHRGRIGGSTLELPMSNWGAPYLYMYGATAHHTPIMNGLSGFEPPVHRKLRESDEKLIFDDAFLDTLEKNGCALVIVNADLCGKQGPPIAKWIAKNLATGRMTFVRRFDHWVYGDWMFAVTKNAKLRGVRSDPVLQQYLDGKASYNAMTFGRMDQPKVDSEVTGDLLVTGWALSPYGLRSATVLIDAGRIRVPAELTPRSDITETWPWYPKCPTPAFTVRVPRSVGRGPENTDVQVEIVDGRGMATRFHDAPVRWR